VVQVIANKVDAELFTRTGKVVGERSLWAERAEQHTIESTHEVFSGIFTAGMCCNASFGSHSMGPIFGGMLLSGKKATELVDERLRQES